MTCPSILFSRLKDHLKEETIQAPVFFVDLNLDQIVDAIAGGKPGYNLKPFYYTSLRDVDAIQYRHEVFRDLENEALFEHIQSFAHKMYRMRDHLAEADKRYYKYQKERWFLDAVEIYGDAVNGLAQNLAQDDLRSRGMLAVRDYLNDYTHSERFTTLLAEKEKNILNQSTEMCMRETGTNGHSPAPLWRGSLRGPAPAINPWMGSAGSADPHRRLARTPYAHPDHCRTLPDCIRIANALSTSLPDV